MTTSSNSISKAETPLSVIEELNHSDNLNWNSDEDDPIISLDQDGLPCENFHQQDSFAGDFYRCGTDWSCLNSDSEKNNKNSTKRLKQCDLFQMWKLPSKNFDASTSQVPNKKMKKSINDFPKQQQPQKQQQQQQRACPFYKKMPGTPFTVDAFRYGQVQGCSAYFLSHFHSDHYGGLSKAWSHGPIYCTPITARLIKMCLYINPLFIHTLDLDVEHVIEGIKVTMLEANHCPGAALIHFNLPSGQCYLHTGDFRASKLMQTYPLLLNQRVNVLYLDTTYCNPKYRFPLKEEVLNFVVKVTKNILKKQPKTLIIVGAYSIGKESVYLAISKALMVKIYANSSRRRILQSFGWPEISGSICTDGNDTPLHVLPMSSLKFEILEKYLKSYSGRYTSVLAFRPTGWTFSETTGSQLDLIKPSFKGSVTIYGVPYSEHSSFTELKEFVQFLGPEKIIPTVNVGNAATRDKMQSCFREWLKGR